MKLNRRQEGDYGQKDKGKEKTADKVKTVNYKHTKIDWKVYQEDLDAVLSSGKYSGRTLRWVKSNDHQYYEWMQDNGIIGSWGLVKLREGKESTKKRYEDRFIASDGTVWICLIEK